MQITIDLPLEQARKLIEFAQKNETTVDQVVDDLIRRSEVAFKRMELRNDALECMVAALGHDLYNPDHNPHVRRPLDPALLHNYETLAPEELMSFLRLGDDKEQRFLRRSIVHHEPLITDATVINGALNGRAIKYIHTVEGGESGLDRWSSGIGIITEDGYWIDIQAVSADYDAKKGFLKALNKKHRAKMIWHVFKEPKKETI